MLGSSTCFCNPAYLILNYKFAWTPLWGKKIFVSFLGFMVLKTTGLTSRFQCKNRFWKLCFQSRDIDQKVSKFEDLVWRAKFWYILTNISGSEAYFSKPIYSLNSWDQAGHFEYNEGYKRTNFFALLMDGGSLGSARGRSSRPCRELKCFGESYISMFDGKISCANSESNFGYFWPPLMLSSFLIGTYPH